jgi:uncharacterized membrane protein
MKNELRQMRNCMEKLSVLHLLFGPLFLIIALLFKFLPPKSVNHFYGYRTPRSMKNEDVWNEANRYSADLMLKFSFVVILYQCVAVSLTSVIFSFLSTVVILTVCLSLMVWLTERHLNQHFDKEGKRIQ